MMMFKLQESTGTCSELKPWRIQVSLMNMFIRLDEHGKPYMIVFSRHSTWHCDVSCTWPGKGQQTWAQHVLAIPKIPNLQYQPYTKNHLSSRYARPSRANVPTIDFLAPKTHKHEMGRSKSSAPGMTHERFQLHNYHDEFQLGPVVPHDPPPRMRPWLVLVAGLWPFCGSASWIDLQTSTTYVYAIRRYMYLHTHTHIHTYIHT